MPEPGSPGLAGKGPGRGRAGAGKEPLSARSPSSLRPSWEGADQGHSRLIDRPRGGPATPPPARPPRCPQVPGDESAARAPFSRPARRRARGGTGADSALAPAAAAAPLCSSCSAPSAAAAMSADPVVFVSAARTAVGEGRRRARRGCWGDAPAGAGRVLPPGPGAERAASVSPWQAPSTAGCRRCPRTSWAPPPSGRCCAGPGWPPRRCRR